jgi:uncharacterized protein
MSVTLDQLRRYAVARTFLKACNLNAAIAQLGYVQADPIRAPARAQDLILFQRVEKYRVDDLEKRYPKLDVFEDMLHNYGFFPNAHRALMYPRQVSPGWVRFFDEHPQLRRKVMRYLREYPNAHPRDVEAAIGDGGRVNGWGGTSSATTLMLEGLHRAGHAIVTRRDAGIRVYAVASETKVVRPSPGLRADGLIQMLVNLYAPVPLRSLNSLVSLIGRYHPKVDYKQRLQAMLKRGELTMRAVDGLQYVWPGAEAIETDVDDRVRLLAPFDPVVWDRRRFEHFWGWAYRFEAYTPPAKRVRGYYALPLLWRENVIGWANVSRANGNLEVEPGFVEKRPRDALFTRALDEEIARFKLFLDC